MSQNNFPSPQPNPLETEAYLELSSAPAIDVHATSLDAEPELSDNTPNLECCTSDSDPDITPDDQSDQHNQPEPQQTEDGFLIARKLRQHNRELVNTVVQLEQALAESQAKLQAQITRVRNADQMISQQADDLTGSQSQISRLNRELEKAKQSARDYQDMAAALEQKFQANQAQLSKIERECALLQEAYNEQQQKLFAAEQEIQDLQARLQRQQRYTLQYKSALEQRGEPPEEMELSRPSSQVPKINRIQPWSDQPLPPAHLPHPAANNSKVTPFPTAKVESISQRPVDFPPPAMPAPPSGNVSEDLGQQLAALEREIDQMSQTVETTVPHSPKEQKQPMPPQFPPLSSIMAHPPAPTVAQRRIQAPLPIQPLPKHRNFPSPTLNPLRSEKKRTSLAAVDLPSFPRR